jgi:hypothetical protein
MEGFWGIFPGKPVLTSIGETGEFTSRKTGLFRRVWIEKLR